LSFWKSEQKVPSCDMSEEKFDVPEWIFVEKNALAEVANFFQIFVETLFFAVVVVAVVVVVVAAVAVVASFCRQDNEDETWIQTGW